MRPSRARARPEPSDVVNHIPSRCTRARIASPPAAVRNSTSSRARASSAAAPPQNPNPSRARASSAAAPPLVHDADASPIPASPILVLAQRTLPSFVTIITVTSLLSTTNTTITPPSPSPPNRIHCLFVETPHLPFGCCSPRPATSCSRPPCAPFAATLSPKFSNGLCFVL